MGRVKVKICGITREEDLMTAVEAGADAVGFVVGVSESPRNLTFEKAKRLMRKIPIFVEGVAVTVSNDPNSLIEVYEELKPDALQIHGEKLSEASVIRGSLPDVRLIKAISAKSDNVVEDAVKASGAFDAILVDSFVNGEYGGTGVVNDWELSKRVRQAVHPKPLILAGGLKPENVKDAILLVQPYAVDVCTGVESRPGIKDPEKVLAFIENAKEVRIGDN